MLKIDFVTTKEVSGDDVSLVLDTIRRYKKDVEFRHLNADELSEDEMSKLQEVYGVFIVPLLAIDGEKTYNGIVPSEQELEARIEQKLKPSVGPG